MTVRSVKGLLLISSVAGIDQGLEAGLFSPEQLELSLEPEDIQLLGTKLDPTGWYPVLTLGRMTELMAKARGGDRAETLRAMGASAAREVRERGTYSQMAFGDGSQRDATVLELKSFVRQVATIHNMLFNFGKTRVEIAPDTETILIHYREMTGYPDATRLSSEGYTSATVSWALGRHCDVVSENLHSDGFTFRFVLDSI